jgi:putative endonuclease
MSFVYILQSEKSGRYYIGSSEDPQKRLIEHNSGKTVSTKNKGPWMLRLSQRYPTLLEARRVEKKLKKFKSRKILEQIIKDGRIKIGL